jgi:hypothetical protein
MALKPFLLNKKKFYFSGNIKLKHPMLGLFGFEKSIISLNGNSPDTIYIVKDLRLGADLSQNSLLRLLLFLVLRKYCA